MSWLTPLHRRTRWLISGCLAAAICLSAVGQLCARTLQQIKSLGVISLCANPQALPFSSKDADMPGFQVEIARAIAERLGVQLKVEWVVPHRRVAEVNCDLLLDNPSDPSVYEGRRLLSAPYHRSGLALALGPQSQGIERLEDLRPQHKIGVMVSSLASVVLGKKGVQTSPYAFQEDMLEDVLKGDLSGAAVSAQTLGYWIKQHPDTGVRAIDLFESEPQLGWTVSAGLRNADEALLNEVNRALSQLVADGTIAAIYAKYGVKHHRP